MSPEPLYPASPPTILAVDDDKGVLKLLGKTLTAAGYHVLLADCGWNAIKAYEKNAQPIHLLLTDVIMPDLTGPVVAQRLRLKQPGLNVLFISGFHDAELVQRFITQQGFGLLPKPFTPEVLLRVVGEALGPLAFGSR